MLQAQQLKCGRHITAWPCSTTGHVMSMHRLAYLPQHPRCCLAAANRDYQQQPVVCSASRLERARDVSSTAEPSCSESWWSRLNWELLLLVAALPVSPALADDGLKYDASRGEGIVKTLSGAAYIGLLLYFLFKVLNRRARKAREERLAGQGPISTVFTKLIEKLTEGKPQPKATPAAAFLGAVQAGLIGFGLFIFATKVEGLVSGQDLPSGYTARNIAITVRTIIIGLLYLATFTFSANAVGLTGLAVQLLLFPDSLPDEVPRARTPSEPQLPKVTVTSSPDEIRKAFKAVANVSGSQSSSSSSTGGSSSNSNISSPVGTQQAAAGTAAAVAVEEAPSRSDGGDSKSS